MATDSRPCLHILTHVQKKVEQRKQRNHYDSDHGLLPGRGKVSNAINHTPQPDTSQKIQTNFLENTINTTTCGTTNRNNKLQTMEPNAWPPWAPAFLRGVADHSGIVLAAKDAGVPLASVYYLREHNQDFAIAWSQALDEWRDSLIREAVRRGRDGRVEDYVIRDGKPVWVWMLGDELLPHPVVIGEDGLVVPIPVVGAECKPLVTRKCSDALLAKALRATQRAEWQDRQEMMVGGVAGSPIQVQSKSQVEQTLIEYRDVIEDAADSG